MFGAEVASVDVKYIHPSAFGKTTVAIHQHSTRASHCDGQATALSQLCCKVFIGNFGAFRKTFDFAQLAFSTWSPKQGLQAKQGMPLRNCANGLGPEA